MCEGEVLLFLAVAVSEDSLSGGSFIGRLINGKAGVHMKVCIRRNDKERVHALQYCQLPTEHCVCVDGMRFLAASHSCVMVEPRYVHVCTT